MLLKLLLAVLIVYTPNQLHFPSDLGLPGLNVVNLIFMATTACLISSGRWGGLSAPSLGTPMRIYFVMMGLGTVVAMLTRPQQPMEDITYLKTLFFYPLYYFLFYYAARDIASVRQLIAAIIFVAVVAALEAWSEALDYGIGSYVESHRAAGPFGPDFRSANRAGVFYAIFVPVLFSLALFLRGRLLWRLVGLGGFLILAGAVLFTYSRQSYFIALLAVALLMLRRGVGMAAFGFAAFLVILPLLPESATQRVEETQQTGKHGEEQFDESTESRWDIWSGAWKMWGENPIGIGLNRFKGMIGGYSNYPGKDAHNYYVLTLAEAGLQGVFSLVFLLFSLWRLGGQLVRAAVDYEGLALAQGFSVATICLGLGNIYGSPFSEGAVMGVIWALAALLERYAQLRNAPPPDAVAA